MTKQHNYYTYDEIFSQTTAWKNAIEVVECNTEKIKKLNLKAYQQIIFIGCGSTYYLSTAAAAQFQAMTGELAVALPSSELLLFPETGFVEGKILLIAISRSGTTSETLRVVSDFKERKLGDVIVVTNYSDSPLAQLADISISIDEGREKSVAQTRSFASMFLAITTITHIFCSMKMVGEYKDTLIGVGNLIIDKYKNLARSLGENQSINQVYYLGSGPRYGLACELSLKLKEMSQTITEAYHFFEFRHGPISMVNDKTLVIGLMSDKVFEQEKAVLEDVAKFGAKIVMVGEKDADIVFNSGLPENVRNVLFLPVLQLLAYYRSVSFGKNPDKPCNITAVVELDIKDMVSDN